jgi:hypothetical protein
VDEDSVFGGALEPTPVVRPVVCSEVDPVVEPVGCPVVPVVEPVVPVVAPTPVVEALVVGGGAMQVRLTAPVQLKSTGSDHSRAICAWRDAAHEAPFLGVSMKPMDVSWNGEKLVKSTLSVFAGLLPASVRTVCTAH